MQKQHTVPVDFAQTKPLKRVFGIAKHLQIRPIVRIKSDQLVLPHKATMKQHFRSILLPYFDVFPVEASGFGGF